MKVKRMLLMVVVICLGLGTPLLATLEDLTNTVIVDGKEINIHQVSGQIPKTPNYEWWYGCSPTAAGMIMGYYDRNGFADLVIGGAAELSTFPSNEGWWNYIAQNMIASVGHVSDFYSAGFGGSGDDPAIPWHSFNCLADFMGTSQDNLSSQFGGNSNGATSFFYYNNNSPLTEGDLAGLGFDFYNMSGMYGIGEYLEYSGYDAETLYNQYIYGHNGILEGFTLEQYQNEIDAGRPVMIHVEGHSMLGYGYVEGTNTINVYDTWLPDGQNPGTMVWGGTYPWGVQNLQHYAVTVTNPIPEPATVVLLGLGMMFLFLDTTFRIAKWYRRTEMLS